MKVNQLLIIIVIVFSSSNIHANPSLTKAESYMTSQGFYKQLYDLFLVWGSGHANQLK